MDKLYMFGANAIKLLQDTFPYGANYFTMVSEVADPGKAFSVAFPVSCVLSISLGSTLLTASVLAEWTNILFKWLLMEHRPYWWVNLAPGRPFLNQTQLTCETGPGSPSGHMTGFTVVSLSLAEWMYKTINEETLIGRANKRRLNKVIQIGMWIFIVNASLSRMYHATHFPHQCLFGICAGLVVSSIVKRCSKWWSNASASEWFFVAFLLAVIGIIVYLFQIVIDINPEWSVELAMKWCSKSEYLHVTTMPLFALVRDVGATFGIALSSPLSKRIDVNYDRKISAILTFLIYFWVRICTRQISSKDPKIFYISHFLLNAVHIYFTLKIIPYLSHLSLTHL